MRPGNTNQYYRILQHLPRWTAPIIRNLKKAATRDNNHREAARSALVSLMEPQRRISLVMGSAWTKRKILKQADDILNLTIAEIGDVIESVIDPLCLATRISDRCYRLEKQRSMTVEEVILRHCENQSALKKHSLKPMLARATISRVWQFEPEKPKGLRGSCTRLRRESHSSRARY
ncbi:MAG: hypothetical protein KZQ93_20700 [Candidatus Thiodiazotropha sp. (ex Monitilora ramsayi)]|nr:hypothetical protein [Candidatus Thiodiazotropha sp. (ex Monitilora ramsayi)]